MPVTEQPVIGLMPSLAECPSQGKIAQETGVTTTMTKDDIQLLFEYDRWANNRVFHAASTLSVEEFTRDLGGSFPSMRDTLVHIIGGEWGWLTIWKEPSLSSAFVTNLWNRLDAVFRPDAFPDIAAAQLKWSEVEREQVEFVNRVSNES